MTFKAYRFRRSLWKERCDLTEPDHRLLIDLHAFMTYAVMRVSFQVIIYTRISKFMCI